MILYYSQGVFLWPFFCRYNSEDAYNLELGGLKF